MKTERFEDKIRKKLESIEPVFQENDWVQFNEYSTAKIASTSSIFKGTIFKIAASVALVGTLFLGISQFISNNDLEKKVANLTAQNEHLLTKQKELEKHIAKKNNIDLYNSNNSSQALSNEKTLLNIETSTADQLKIVAGQISKKGSLINKTKSIDNPEFIAKNGNSSANKKGDLYFENKNNSANKSNFSTHDNVKSKNIDSDYLASGKSKSNSNNGLVSINTNESSDVNLVSIDNKLISNKLIFNELTKKGIQIDSNRKLLKSLSKSDFAYYRPVDDQNKKLYFTLADAYFRTGISANAAKGLVSIGLNSELFFDQRISLKVGAKKLNLTGQNYKTELNFKVINDREFRDKYNVKVPSTKAILNIREDFEILAVPINLSYYQPLENNLFLIGSIGTDLDIRGKKTIEFNYNKAPFYVVGAPKESEMDLDKLIQKTEKKAFNNINLSVGAEKRFGKLALQGKIIDQFLVKNIDYRNKNSIGAELGMYYRF